MDYEIDNINKTILIENQDRVPRTEVEEMVWPRISIGEINFAKGIAIFEIGFLGESFGNIEIKGVIMRKIN